MSRSLCLLYYLKAERESCEWQSQAIISRKRELKWTCSSIPIWSNSLAQAIFLFRVAYFWLCAWNEENSSQELSTAGQTNKKVWLPLKWYAIALSLRNEQEHGRYQGWSGYFFKQFTGLTLWPLLDLNRSHFEQMTCYSLIRWMHQPLTYYLLFNKL